MAENPETSAVLTGCLYEMSGQICGQTVRARGYCKRHYNVLARRGAFKPAEPQAIVPGSAITEAQIDRNLGHLERARLKLEQHTEALVGHILVAAEVAAKKGDSKPAEWALLHARAVQPVLTGGGATAGTNKPLGVRVLVGVNLGQHSSRPTTIPATLEPSQLAAESQNATLVENAGALDHSDPSLPTVEATVIAE